MSTTRCFWTALYRFRHGPLVQAARILSQKVALDISHDLAKHCMTSSWNDWRRACYWFSYEGYYCKSSDPRTQLARKNGDIEKISHLRVHPSKVSRPWNGSSLRLLAHRPTSYQGLEMSCCTPTPPCLKPWSLLAVPPTSQSPEPSQFASENLLSKKGLMILLFTEGLIISTP